jgi:hypothetical protein
MLVLLVSGNMRHQKRQDFSLAYGERVDQSENFAIQAENN